MEKKASAEKAVREIRRKTRRRFSAEEEIRIVIEGLRGLKCQAKVRPSWQPCPQWKTSMAAQLARVREMERTRELTLIPRSE